MLRDAKRNLSEKSKWLEVRLIDIRGNFIESQLD
jgi:hypothetical protein